MNRTIANLALLISADKAQFENALQSMDRQLSNTARRIDQLGRQLSVGLSTPLTAIGVTSFNTFREFEQQMAKVQAVSGATAAEFDRLEANAKELGSTTRFTASEVAALQLEYSKLGFTAEEITQVTAATLALAQATDSDLSQAASVAGSTLRAFGLDASETARVTDVMASSFSSTALDMDKFAESMKYVAPVANSAGISIEETTALLGTLANAGITGSQAGTALRRIISDLGDTGGDVSGAIAELASQGLNLADAKDEVGRSAQSALLVLAGGIGTTEQLTSTFMDAEGAAAAMAATMDDTAEGSMKKMQSAVEGAQLAIGEALAPAVSGAADVVSFLASAFTELSPAAQTTVAVMGGLGAAIGPTLLVIPRMIRAFQALNVVMKANPAGVIITALVLLGTAVGTYVSQLDSAAAAQSELNSLQEAAARSVAAEKVELDQLLRVAQDETRSKEEREAAIKKLNQISPQYLGNLNLENINTKEATKATQDYIKELERKARVQAAQERLVEIEKELLDLQQDGIDGLSLVDQAVSGLAASLGNVGVGQARYNTALGDLLARKNALIGVLDQEQNIMSDLNTETEAGSNNTNTLADASDRSAKSLKDQADAANQLTDALGGLNGSATTNEDLFGVAVNPNLQDGPNLQDIDDSFQIDSLLDEDSLDADIEKWNERKELLLEDIDQVISKADGMGAAFGQAFGDLVTGAASADAVLKGIAKNMIQQVLRIAKANVITNATSPTNVANLASGGLATPGLIVAGLSMLEGFVNAFAEGGMVTGPQLALVGDNPSGKEAIIPFEKMGAFLNMAGAGNNSSGHVEFYIQGTALKGVLRNQDNLDKISM